MQIAGLSNESIIHIVEIGGMAFLAYVGLQLKNGQLNAKIETMNAVRDLQGDINDKHLENQTTIQAHIAADEARDEANSRTFKRIDETLVRLAGPRPR